MYVWSVFVLSGSAGRRVGAGREPVVRRRVRRPPLRRRRAVAAQREL